MLNTSIHTSYMHNNIYGNVSKQKEFNDYVDKMDTNTDPQWMQNLDGEDYKVAKDLLDATIEAFIQMKANNISLNDLFYRNNKATIWGKSFGATTDKAEADSLRFFLESQNVVDNIMERIDLVEKKVDEQNTKLDELIKILKEMKG